MSGSPSGAGSAVKPENNKSIVPRKDTKPPVKKNEGSKFLGEIEALHGHIYDTTYNQAELYVKTTKRIGNHIGATVKGGDLIQAAMEHMELPTFQLPEAPPVGASRAEEKIWDKRVDEVIKQETLFGTNMRGAYFTVWCQCSENLRSKIEAKSGYKKMAAKRDLLELLRVIKDITHNFQSEKNPDQALHEAKRRYHMQYQDRSMGVTQYHDKFKNMVDVIEHCGGTIVDGMVLKNTILKAIAAEDLDGLITKKIEEIYEKEKERQMACAFLLSADRTRFGRLVEDLENSYIEGNNRYPQTLEEAHKRLEYWKQDPRNMIKAVGADADGVAFAQNGEKKQVDVTQVTCFICKDKGHYANKCPKRAKDTEGQVHAQEEDSKPEESVGHSHLQLEEDLLTSFQFCMITEEHSEPVLEGMTCVQGSGIPKSWIILDNGSTIDVFCNKGLLENIREVKETMRIKCNAGTTVTNLKGDLPGYGPVWYNPEGIANILSLARVGDKYRITYDSGADAGFKIHKEDGTTRLFRRSRTGLFYVDTDEQGVVLVNTVEGIARNFTKREVVRAQAARKLQNTLGFPSTRNFIDIVNSNVLNNCPITAEDIQNAELLFGPNLGSLKGKTVRRSGAVVEPFVDNVPPALLDRCRDITLCADIMFVNKTIFLITISRQLKFGTGEVLENRKGPTILKAFDAVRKLYERRGLRVRVALMDGEFEPLRTAFLPLGITLNVASNAEHVPEVERYIRTVKERTRCLYNSVPFKSFPRMMIAEMVYCSIFWLNSLPVADGISDRLSPRYILVGSTLDFNRHCRLEFGTYVQVHEDHDNTMASRTVGAIALRPTGNAQGGFYFMSLETGRKLNRNHWTALPMPKDVIDRVHVIARQTGSDHGLAFGNRRGDLDDPDTPPIEGVDDDPDPDNIGDAIPIEPNNLEPNNIIANPNDNEVVEVEEIEEGIVNPNDNEVVEVEEIEEGEIEVEEGEIEGVEEEGEIEGVPYDVAEDDSSIEEANVEAPEPEVIEVPDDEDIEGEMNQRYGPRTERYNLRPRKPRDYGHLHVALEETCMTQYSVRKGLKVFGKEGATAVITEMRQLDERGVIKPKKASLLTREEKRRALMYLMFLKKKRCGRIKGRGCADGRKQRVYKRKEETSAPTVAIESVMISCAIDAYERRFVATADVPGAFMHADMDEVLYMRIDGPLAKLLVEVNPERYKDFLEYEGDTEVIYVLLEKALYGTLQAALLFWRDLSGKLLKWGFTLNSYDNCVANKIIDGYQCTVLWHVDDIKISHVNPKVVEMILSLLNEEYGKEAPLVVTRGEVHEYLGMTLDFSVPGKCRVGMDGYVEEVVEEYLSGDQTPASTPAALHLFEVNENQEKLGPQEAAIFHQVTAKLLFLCKRARPDIQTAVAFLTTRVKGPDKDDQKKLQRVLSYLSGTKGLTLTLEATDLSIAKWWVDGSYAVHNDMRSHTGGTMSLGKGSIYSTSIRQKLNTKSSTETELVAVADVMPQVLWTGYFLKEQGYGVGKSTIYQDNKSAILLEENGRSSSGKRTRHLNIRYFFVTDRISSNEIQVEYCPTGEMRGDFFTKPLQGSLFQKFCKEILNL